MTQKSENVYNSYSKRKPLIDQLPLAAPLGIHICASSYCNFQCYYCVHSQESHNGRVGNTGWLNKEFMELSLLEKVINDLSQFPQKIKLVQFAWMGEPLLHPDIARMVKMVKSANVAETVSIVSNGSKLTPDLSDALIDAGLDRLRISIQGLNQDAYKKVTNNEIDFDAFLKNLQYFYTHKRQTEVYIKIMDVMLKSKTDEALFRDLFSNKCDIINIEHLIPMHNEIDLEEYSDNFEYTHTGSRAKEGQICPYPFFEIQISPNGLLFPCCSVESQITEKGDVINVCLGDVKKERLLSFWNGERLKEFRRMMIRGNRNQHPICGVCPLIKYETAEEDRLDGNEELLENIY